MLRSKYVPLSKSAIQPDQPLLFPVYNSQGTLLAEKGTELSLAQVQKLDKVTEVFTLNRALLSAAANGKGQDDKDSAFRLPPPMERLTSIEKILEEVYSNPHSSTAMSKVLTLINRLQGICDKSPDAAIAKIITDSTENYAVRHALHTAILCELTSTHLDWSIEEKRNLLGAALTMNVSMGFMQDILLDQPQPLTIEQQEVINNHPTASVEILKGMGIQNIDWLEFVEKHHEAIDGSGYPKGHIEKDIPLGALLIKLSDIYCAKVSGRSYRKPIYANVATRDIFLEKDNANKGTLIEIFVKILGLYPPGCIVRLQNLEVGIVVKRGDRIDTPIVHIISPKDTRPNAQKVRRHTSEKNYAITETLPVSEIHFDLDYGDMWPY